MTLFLLIIAFWGVVIFGGRFFWKHSRRWWTQWPVRLLSEIKSVEFYRQLSPTQMDALVLRALRAHEFQLLDNPFLGRGQKQGYAWKGGKKIVVAYGFQSPLTDTYLNEVARSLRRAKAEKALLFHPFDSALDCPHHDIEVLWGQKLVSWFSVLGDIPLPSLPSCPAERCECGAPMKSRVNSHGRRIMVCGRFPDCRGIHEATSVVSAQAPVFKERLAERSRLPRPAGAPSAGSLAQLAVQRPF